MKKTTRLLALLLSLLMVLSLTATAFAADDPVIASGGDGVNAKWTLTEGGVLTVSGNGPIVDEEEIEYDEDGEISSISKLDCIGWQISAVWDKLAENMSAGDAARTRFDYVKTLVIEEGITEIPDGEFDSFCPRTIRLPLSLQKLGSEAINARYCESLTIPNPELQIFAQIPVAGYSKDAKPFSSIDDAIDGQVAFETKTNELSQKLDSMRWNLRIADDGWRPVKLKLDYERLAKLLPKWGVDACEYGRYIQHAKEAGLDLRNEGTLYPPVTGGRKAFMRRLEELEANAAKMKAAAIDKAMSERAPEIAAFQESVERTKTLHGCGYKIVLAKTQGELLAEGKRMGNCIGNGVYGRGIATGHKLIVMLKLPGVRGGKSFCDIEIDRHTWKVRQCYTKGNRIPPDEVRELANRIATFLKAEYKRQQRKAKKGKAA